ncbi:hypothetical protein, partial [Verrucomicrobium spinosum]|uniref:hypothetical protein n=1 Tax=Verrucomicrobium spinosum TaxID=2736 RepID=UPI00210CA2CC
MGPAFRATVTGPTGHLPGDQSHQFPRWELINPRTIQTTGAESCSTHELLLRLEDQIEAQVRGEVTQAARLGRRHAPGGIARES